MSGLNIPSIQKCNPTPSTLVLTSSFIGPSLSSPQGCVTAGPTLCPIRRCLSSCVHLNTCPYGLGWLPATVVGSQYTPGLVPCG